MSKRLLQIINVLLALMTIGLAGNSLFTGVNNGLYAPAEIPANPALDSNLRFMGGMGIGLGLALLYITPAIEKHTQLFRTVWLVALLGGIGRLVSWFVVAAPPTPVLAFTLIEVVGVPILLFWQNRLAQAAEN
ncbi:MAG TPA: DUF4345 domain-containing protein [Anaerolineales bacterium]|nr:DUF4345 domain-containing protein [Anaerolineales bacterium]